MSRRSELTKKTVKQLRTICGSLNLPKYQCRGERLRKGDLVESILRFESKNRAKLAKLTEEEIESIILSRVSSLTLNGGWPDDIYARAMHRILQRVDNQHDRAIIDRRRITAIRSIRDDHEPGSREWMDWNNRHDHAVHMSLGGMLA